MAFYCYRQEAKEVEVTSLEDIYKEVEEAHKPVSLFHFGPIPGVPVGTWWRYRVEVCKLQLCLANRPSPHTLMPLTLFLPTP